MSTHQVMTLDTELSTDERTELARLEDVVNRGIKTFIEVGTALMSIRDGRLYRETHGSFEDYCRERWDIERAHAYRLMGASQVALNVSPRGDNTVMGGLSPRGDIPTSEKQVRPLVSLPPEKQREAWTDAVKTAGDRQPTAREVDAAARRVTGKPERPDAKVKAPPTARPTPVLEVVPAVPTIQPGSRHDVVLVATRDLPEATELATIARIQTAPGGKYLTIQCSDESGMVLDITMTLERASKLRDSMRMAIEFAGGTTIR